MRASAAGVGSGTQRPGSRSITIEPQNASRPSWRLSAPSTRSRVRAVERSASTSDSSGSTASSAVMRLKGNTAGLNGS